MSSVSSWQAAKSAHICENRVTRCLRPPVRLSLQWRHNGCYGVSNYQSHDCLLNYLFRCRSKKTSKLRITGLCAGNSPVTGEFPAQRPVTRKMFPFDDLMTSSWYRSSLNMRIMDQRWLWYFLNSRSQFLSWSLDIGDWHSYTSMGWGGHSYPMW